MPPPAPGAAAVPTPPSIVSEPGLGRSSVLGIPIELGDPAQLLRTIVSWTYPGAKREQTRTVTYVNAHVVNQSRALAPLHTAIGNADLVYCDGYGVRLAARALDVPVPHRMTGADWVWGLATLLETTGASLYLLGSEPTVSAEASATLTRWYPRLNIAGSHHGYFELGSAHDERVVEDINERRPNIVLVGMGTPKQELWVQRNRDRLDVDVLWTVGALFDYIAGRVPRAPRWLSDNGLEWIFRLAVEPHRMWRRYLIGNPEFLSRVYAERRRAR